MEGKTLLYGKRRKKINKKIIIILIKFVVFDVGRESWEEVMFKGHLLFIHKRMWLKRIFPIFHTFHNSLTIPFHLIFNYDFFVI